MGVFEEILKLSKQLYPTGRAFKNPNGSFMDGLNRALSVSESQAVEDANSILDNILPDNDNFTAQDATDWEGRLGMIVNPTVDLEDRKAAILRKMNHPGTIPARQSHLYLQGQLDAAGFNVFVFENRFPLYGGGFETQNPITVSGGNFVWKQHGNFQHGQFSSGKAYDNIVANKIDENEKFKFDIGTNLRSTFFVGGTPFGTFADVPLNRKDEFRQLILQIKPVQTVGLLFINYV